MQLSDGVMIDREQLFRLIHGKEWTEAAALLHRYYRAVPDDPVLQHASAAFLTSVTEVLADTDADVDRPLLEQLFLLHEGRFLALPTPLFERVVERLVQAHADNPSAAAAYARYAPSNAHCAAILDKFGDARRRKLESDPAVAVAYGRDAPRTPNATRPLLRSAQEMAFYRAVRDVFPTFLVYPNVAVSAVLDYERLKDRLTRDERHYFFRALIDCVVFEPTNGCWPRYFFEVDSPLHDDADRKRQDVQKDRIIAAAGQRLIRIRREPGQSTDEFERLIRAGLAEAARLEEAGRATE